MFSDLFPFHFRGDAPSLSLSERVSPHLLSSSIYLKSHLMFFLSDFFNLLKNSL